MAATTTTTNDAPVRRVSEGFDIRRYGSVGRDGFRYLTLDDLKMANRDAGMYFFSRDTMRFFRSRVGYRIYQGPGGYYFVTSEQFVGSDRRPGLRQFTVRRFDPETGDIATVGEFNALTRRQAKYAAERLSKGLEARTYHTKGGGA